MLSPTGPFLPEIAVERGWVKLREKGGRDEYGEEAAALLEKLKALEAKAKAASEGLWASGGGTIENSHDLSNPQAFVEQWKGKQVDGSVPHLATDERC